MQILRFGFTGNSRFLTELSTSLGQWWYILIATAGSAIVSISASFAGTYDLVENWSCVSDVLSFASFLQKMPWLWLGLGTIMILYGGKGIYIDQQNLSKKNKELTFENSKINQLKETINSISEDSELLQNELAELQIKLVTTWLKGSARQLKLGTNCRVTIYYYVSEHFYVLARYSQNPKYSEIHRQKFSRNHGVISKAWEHKSCVDIVDIPCYKEDSEKYKKYMLEKYGYPMEKTDKLTMKSCQYVAISIVEADNHIGVIVFESDKRGLLKDQKVAQIRNYCTDYQSYMVDFIHGGIKYDKTVKISSYSEQNVDDEFMKTFGGEA